MKKTAFLLMALFMMASYAMSQSCGSCRVSSYNYLKYGELDNAKAQSDFCITCDKNKTNPYVWYYRGLIYQSIHTSKDFKKLDANAADVAFNSYRNALLYNFVDPNLQKLNLDDQTDVFKFFTALNDQKTKYVDQEILVDILMNQFPPLSNIFVNKGVEVYQNDKDYKKAYELFGKSLFVSGMSMRVDTPVIYYSAIVAEKAGLYKEAKESFDLLIKLNYGKDDKEKASNYYFLGNIYKSMGDTVKYVETLKKGIDKYPTGSAALVVELINYYMSHDKAQEAIAYLDLAIKNAPDNATYYFVKGSLYDRFLKDYNKAIENYKMATSLDAKYFDPVYNLGALYFNQAVEIYEKLGDIKDQKEYEKMKKVSDDKFRESMPYLEKSFELNDKDLPTVESLRNVYYRLKMDEKFEKMDALWKELKK